MMARRELLKGSIAMAALIAAGPVVLRAQERRVLRLGVATEWFSLDPHFHSFPANRSMAHNIYSALTETDAQDRLQPSLAESWEPEGDTAWLFKLRADAKFSDGTPVTADDVVASIERVPLVETSSPLTSYIRTVAGAEMVDERTVRVKTATPDPILPKLLSTIHVVQKRFAGEKSEVFDALTAAIGSGPFKVERWDRGERLVLVPNEHYWGSAPAWSQVEYRILTDTPARVAALLAGDVDFVQTPSTESMARLLGDERIKVVQAPSSRITFIQFHQGEASLDDMSGTDGKNPFADLRVRQAVSLAIPRAAIRERIMGNLSTVAGQIVAPGRDGHNDSVPVDPYDLERAAALLAEAGWADGFKVRLVTANDRNVNGVKIAQAVAASLARLKITVDVAAVPLSVQQQDFRDGKLSMFLHGNGPTVEPYQMVANLVHTNDKERSLGSNNLSKFSNAELDGVIEASLVELDGARRTALMEQAATLIHQNMAIVPIHYEEIVHATLKPVATVARGDEGIYAADFVLE